MFQQAESLHMTVTELLKGRGTPMSNYEYAILPYYYDTKAHHIKQAEKKQKR